MENVTGAYALYEFLKELVESGQLKERTMIIQKFTLLMKIDLLMV